MQKKQVDKKKYMRKLYPWLLGMILGIMPCIVSASENDSIKVESLLQKAARLPADSCRILFFAQNLLGVPYVANTLDGTDEERLVVHLDKVNCTTLVETVLALSLADKYGKSDFESYKKRCSVSAIGMENKPVMSRVYITSVIGLRITNRKELYMNVRGN